MIRNNRKNKAIAPIPVMKGTIDRRILVNYTINPDLLAAQLPPPFRPKLINNKAIGGICLIRLKHVRPASSLLPWGLSSENGAHRIAVEWEQNGEIKEGVYIPRRDTDSRLNTLVGGRLFPGVHHYAKFTTHESAVRYSVSLESTDHHTHVSVAGLLADKLPADSVFSSLKEASDFFEAGSLGYSTAESPSLYDGLELHCHQWHMDALAVQSVSSSYFDDVRRFPHGSVQFDSALLMRGIQHEWRGKPPLSAT